MSNIPRGKDKEEGGKSTSIPPRGSPLTETVPCESGSAMTEGIGKSDTHQSEGEEKEMTNPKVYDLPPLEADPCNPEVVREGMWKSPCSSHFPIKWRS